MKKNKKIYFSFVMGRLSKKIGNHFQYFPIDNWQNEISLSKKFNFTGMEWIISDFSNPIFNNEFLKIIKNNLVQKKIAISSISMDLIMDNPLHTISKLDLYWLIEKILFLQKNFKLPRISFPIEERARFKSKDQKKTAIKNLKIIVSKLSPKSKICIETDLPIKTLTSLFKSKGLEKLGILIDIGNIRANGFKIENYFKHFSNKIYGIHIKYRDKNFGKSKIIKRNFRELEYVKSRLNKLKNLNDITFQTYRSDNYFIKDIKKNLKNYETTSFSN